MGDSPSKTYVRDITGRPRVTDDESLAQSYVEGGAKPISKAEALQSVKAGAALDSVDQMGAVGKTAAGFGSGLTLGLGPAALEALGVVDADTLDALGTSGFYQGGDIAGMLAPAILSGGEAVAARGAVGAERGLIARALAASPAGQLGRAGSLAEALAGRVLPEAGVMGKLARPAFQMASRGATEGALVSIAHTASDEIIHDKPLTWASIAAAGMDGALLGGLAGGAFGVASAGLGGVTDLAAGSMGRGGEAGAATAARRVGAGTKDLVAMGESEGGVIGSVRKYHDILENGGESFHSSTPAILKAAKKSEIDATTTAANVVKTLDSEAPQMVPSLERVLGRIDTDLNTKYAGTMLHGEALSVSQKLSENLSAVKSWENWTTSRAQMADALKSANGTVQADVYRTAISAADSEIRMSMEAAAEAIGKPGLSEAFHGALMTQKLSSELAEMVSKKGARELERGMGLELGGGDLGALAYSTLAGHPLGGAAIVAGKKIVQHLQRKMEPAIAEAAYRAAVGAEAGATTARVGARMSESVKRFMTGTSRVAVGESTPKADRAPKLKYDLKSYDEAVSSTEKLLDASHRAKVETFVSALAEMGHPDLAKEAMDGYQRSMEYLRYNMPASRTNKQAGSMGKMPTPFGLDTKQNSFMRIQRAVRQPLSILEDLENGSLSREAVKAVKYVSPPLYKELVTRTAMAMLEVKSEGKFLPADKVAMIGTVLDAPVDSKLEKGFIDAVQAAHSANRMPTPEEGSAQAPITDISAYQTPLQASV